MTRPMDLRGGPRAAPALLARGLVLLLAGATASVAEAPDGGSLRAWRYVQDLPVPPGASARLDDFVLPAAVFDGARLDLGDMRLIDKAGREVPYDLRVRRPDYREEAVPASEFNRSAGPGRSAELALDLGPNAPEHNEVEVALPGLDYRRRARLEGGADGTEWRTLREKGLIRFRVGDKEIEDRRIAYPPSRFRYLRVRVESDPVVDQKGVEVGAVRVRRRVEVPGEYLVQPGRLGPREPVRAGDGPGSAWVIDLGGDRVPCERIDCEVADAEFVRNYAVEAGGPPGSDEPFRRVGSGVWRRRAGEVRTPMVAEFGEVQASRLRLVVTDYSNPPLDLRGATFRAPARQVAFALPAGASGPLRLYSGNPKAEPPRYDFARNLPARLEPPPTRLTLGPRRENPAYQPEPKPLTERWPWLIYLVLGAVSLGLGVIIADLARTAAALHDARRAGEVG
jgi:hypothetical protein